MEGDSAVVTALAAEVVVRDCDDFEVEVFGGLVVGEHVFAEVGEEDLFGLETVGGAAEAFFDGGEFEDAFDGGGCEEVLADVAVSGPLGEALGGALEEGGFV